MSLNQDNTTESPSSLKLKLKTEDEQMATDESTEHEVAQPLLQATAEATTQMQPAHDVKQDV